MSAPAALARADPGGAFCPRCRVDLEHARLTSGRRRCPSCGGAFEATRFDPPSLAAAPRSLGEAAPGAATACADHRGNVAVANCGRCGVFMCELCRIDADGQVLCPSCFDRLSAEGALASTRTTFRDYGRLGFTYLLLGLLFSFVAAPVGLAVVYAGVQLLRQRARIGEGSAVRAWVLIVLGALEALGGAAMLYWLVTA